MAKYWSFSLNISPSNEHPGLISFRMDWVDLLAVQGTLKSLLQHHSSKASILQCSAYFIVQLSHPYMTTGKTILKENAQQFPEILKILPLIFRRTFGFPEGSVMERGWGSCRPSHCRAGAGCPGDPFFLALVLGADLLHASPAGCHCLVCPALFPSVRSPS